MRWIVLALLAISCGSEDVGPRDGGAGSGGNSPDAMRDAPSCAFDCDLPPYCDPTTGGGCPDPAAPKCALTFPDPRGTGIQQCTDSGAVSIGGACTIRVFSGEEFKGDDDCAPGGYCSEIGAAQGRQCRAYCSETAPCSSGSCFTLTEPWGICVDTCDPFATQNPCPQNDVFAPQQACSLHLLVGETASGAFCYVAHATAPVGGSCDPFGNPPRDCAQGGICLVDNLCYAICDNNHGCGAGETCQPATFLTGNTCDAAGNGCPFPEQCDRATMLCTVAAPGPNNWGFCIATPDAGGSVILRAYGASRASVAHSADFGPR